MDKLGEFYAASFDIPVKQFLPDWDQFGKGAGYIRNIKMAVYADALLAIWDGKSKGTQHMIEIMRKAGKPTHVFTIPEGEHNKN